MILEAKTYKGNPMIMMLFCIKTRILPNLGWYHKRKYWQVIRIIIDNEVFSYPRVTTEIRNGMACISSDMTLEQAKALSTTLPIWSYPIRF